MAKLNQRKQHKHVQLCEGHRPRLGLFVREHGADEFSEAAGQADVSQGEGVQVIQPQLEQHVDSHSLRRGEGGAVDDKRLDTVPQLGVFSTQIGDALAVLQFVYS